MSARHHASGVAQTLSAAPAAAAGAYGHPSAASASLQAQAGSVANSSDAQSLSRSLPRSAAADAHSAHIRQASSSALLARQQPSSSLELSLPRPPVAAELWQQLSAPPQLLNVHGSAAAAASPQADGGADTRADASSAARAASPHATALLDGSTLQGGDSVSEADAINMYNPAFVRASLLRMRRRTTHDTHASLHTPRAETHAAQIDALPPAAQGMRESGDVVAAAAKESGAERSMAHFFAAKPEPAAVDSSAVADGSTAGEHAHRQPVQAVPGPAGQASQAAPPSLSAVAATSSDAAPVIQQNVTASLSKPAAPKCQHGLPRPASRKSSMQRQTLWTLAPCWKPRRCLQTHGKRRWRANGSSDSSTGRQKPWVRAGGHRGAVDATNSGTPLDTASRGAHKLPSDKLAPFDDAKPRKGAHGQDVRAAGACAEGVREQEGFGNSRGFSDDGALMRRGHSACDASSGSTVRCVSALHR